VDETKLQWVAEAARCPGCGHEGLELHPTELVCPGCNRTYSLRRGVVDFLHSEVQIADDLIEKKHEPDHPFDGNALTIIERCREVGGMILDCGSGYRNATFPNVVQMDMLRHPSVDVLALNQRLPFATGSFDAVFSLDALEHTSDPLESALEICRVLRPGGYLYIDVPFLQSEHGYPYHYFNVTRAGVRQLFSGLEVLSHHVPMSGRAIVMLHQLLERYRAGLAPEPRAAFSQMTVDEILGLSPLQWVDDPVGSALRPELEWTLAATTQALMRKEEKGGAPSRLKLSPVDLPGFPEFEAERAVGRGQGPGPTA
jgi:SAM-dependent methyltransferase